MRGIWVAVTFNTASIVLPLVADLASSIHFFSSFPLITAFAPKSFRELGPAIRNASAHYGTRAARPSELAGEPSKYAKTHNDDWISTVKKPLSFIVDHNGVAPVKGGVTVETSETLAPRAGRRSEAVLAIN